MYFLWQAHHSLLALKNIRQPFSTMLGNHFKQQNYQQKHRNGGDVAFNRPQKDTGLYHRSWTKKSSVHVQPQLARARLTMQIFCSSAHIREWRGRCCKGWFWSYEYILGSRRISKSVNEDQLCFEVRRGWSRHKSPLQTAESGAVSWPQHSWKGGCFSEEGQLGFG